MSELADEGAVIEPVDGPVDEPVADATPAEPAAPAEPALNPVELQAELEYMRSQYEQLAQYVQQSQPQAQAPQVDTSTPNFFDEYGNFDPSKFATWQQARDEALVNQFQQTLSPLQQTFQQQQEAAQYEYGLERARDMLGDEISRNGEFASTPEADEIARERVLSRANALMDELSPRYGATPRTAELAIQRAAAEERAYLRSVGGAAVSQTQNQLATLAGAKGEPGAHGAGVEAPVIRIGETSASRFAQ